MSDNFTYELPNDEKYKNALSLYLKSKNQDDLYEIVERAKVSIKPSSSYSRRRWNAMWTEIIFSVPMEIFDQIEDGIKEHLRGICDTVMPVDAGYDVMSIDFTINIDEEIEGINLVDDIKKISGKIDKATRSFHFPNDIMEKGTEMGESYIYLYFVENFIRLFIDKTFTDKFGADYIQKIMINEKLKNAIIVRKSDEEKNKWLSIRGKVDLFYLDFKDLGQIIRSNWGHFSSFFPDQAWISTKIEELADCRNLVAHNSYIGSHERDVIRVNFNSIIRQIEQYL